MIINCNKIAKSILDSVDGGTLVVIRNYDDPSAISYVRQLIKTADSKKIKIIEEDYGYHSTTDSVDRIISSYNSNDDVDGILLVSPGQQHLECLQRIAPSKNVEGNDFDDNINRVSCTARACVEIAKSVVKDFEQTKFLVVGYGKYVGKPVAYLLMRMHASSVITTHQYTRVDDLFNKYIPQSDVIISAVGSPYFIKGDYEGKIFIDAGISILNSRVVGDVHPDLDAKNQITSVPGGVGPVTTALLLKNVSLASRREF